jgi:F-type H+-transporting ATPase subunit epsilon
MIETSMHLQVLLPFEIFVDESGIKSVVVDTAVGSFGLLPRRLDCVAALNAGILSYTTQADEIIYIAIDAGILVKVGAEVSVSVRQAKSGLELNQLYEAVKEDFLNKDEQEREIRSSLAKLESGFVRRMTDLQR